jgi:putative transposase
MQNGYIDGFNSLYREAILDAYVFREHGEVRCLTRE